MATKSIYDTNKVSVGTGSANKALTDGVFAGNKIKYMTVVDSAGTSHVALDYATYTFDITGTTPEIQGEGGTSYVQGVVSSKVNGLGTSSNVTYYGTTSHTWGVNESESSRSTAYTLTQANSNLTGTWSTSQEGNQIITVTDKPSTYYLDIDTQGVTEIWAMGGTVEITPNLTGTATTYKYWNGYTDFKTNEAHRISKTTQSVSSSDNITLSVSTGSVSPSVLTSNQTAEFVIPVNKSLYSTTIIVSASTASYGYKTATITQGANQVVTEKIYGTPSFSVSANTYDFPTTGGSVTVGATLSVPYTAYTYWSGTSRSEAISTSTSSETIANATSISVSSDYSGVFSAPSAGKCGTGFGVTATTNAGAYNDRECTVTVSTTYNGTNYSNSVRLTQSCDSSSLSYLTNGSLSYSEIPVGGGLVSPSISFYPVYQWSTGEYYTGSQITTGYEITNATYSSTNNGWFGTGGTYIAYASAATMGTTEATDSTLRVSGASVTIKWGGKFLTVKTDIKQAPNEKSYDSTEYAIGTLSSSPSSITGGTVTLTLSYAKQRTKYIYDSGSYGYGDYVVSTASFSTTYGTLNKTSGSASSPDGSISFTLALTSATVERNVTVTATNNGQSTTTSIRWYVGTVVEDKYGYSSMYIDLTKNYSDFTAAGGSGTIQATMYLPYSSVTHYYGSETVISYTAHTQTLSNTLSVSSDSSWLTVPSTVTSQNSFTITAASNAKNTSGRSAKVTVSGSYNGYSASNYVDDIYQEGDSAVLVSITANAYYDPISPAGGTSAPSVSVNATYRWADMTTSTTVVTTGYSVAYYSGYTYSNDNGQAASIDSAGNVSVGTLGAVFTSGENVIASAVALTITYQTKTAHTLTNEVNQYENSREVVSTDYSLGDITLSPTSLTAGTVSVSIPYARYRYYFKYDSGSYGYDDYQAGTVSFSLSPTSSSVTLAKSSISASSSASSISNTITVSTTASTDTSFTLTATLGSVSKTGTFTWTAPVVSTVKFAVESDVSEIYSFWVEKDGTTYDTSSTSSAIVPYESGDYKFYVFNDSSDSITIKLTYGGTKIFGSWEVGASSTDSYSFDLKGSLGDMSTDFTLTFDYEDL